MGPGLPISMAAIEQPNDQDWLKFDLLSLTARRGHRYSHSLGHGDLEVDNSSQVMWAETQLIAIGMWCRLQIFGRHPLLRPHYGDHRNEYKFDVDPGKTARRGCIYVNTA